MRLSVDARQDMRGVIAFTLESFGADQATGYENAFFDAFERIAEFPEVAPAPNQNAPAERVLLVGSHRIWYRVGDHEIEVAAITHIRSAIDPFTPRD